MTAGVAVVRAVCELRYAGGGPVLAVGRWPFPGVAAAGHPLLYRRVAACDFLAAGPGAGCAVRAVADVLMGHCVPRRPGGAAWLPGVLARYPGCGVAVAPAGGGECLAAARGPFPALALGARGGTPQMSALVCGAFVHVWLCAGLPLAALRSAGAGVVVPRPRAACGRGTQGMMSCSLSLWGMEAPAAV